MREWFGERLRQTNEAAWKAAHGRLYEHLRDTTKEGKTPTLEDLAPLYQAITHGCRAGLYQQALDDILVTRIYRHRQDGKFEGYAVLKLGGIGTTLAVISWFFSKAFEAPHATLTNPAASFVLAEAAFNLRAQGRFMEALPAARAALRMEEEAARWHNAAINSGNLSAAELVFGSVAAAVSTAAQSVIYADRSTDEFQMMSKRSIHADALHAAGQRDEADRLFRDSEERQKKSQPKYPILYSVQGYLYCDLLLAKGDWTAARGRGTENLLNIGSDPLLDRALVRLALGRAHLGFALGCIRRQQPPGSARDNARASRVRLDETVDGLRRAGTTHHIPRGLLARVGFRRSVGDWGGAARDLDEVEEIADLGPMKLFLCDMALERARLAFAKIEAFAPLNGMLEKDNPPKPVVPSAEEIAELKSAAERQLKIAADYIEKCGHHRRDAELAELQAVLRGEKKFADLPPRV